MKTGGREPARLFRRRARRADEIISWERPSNSLSGPVVWRGFRGGGKSSHGPFRIKEFEVFPGRAGKVMRMTRLGG